MKAKDGIQPPTPPKIRIPRLPEGLDMTELAKSVWTRPTFRAEEIDGITTFIFSISLRDKMRSKNEPVYRSLFESGGTAWTTALQKAYVSAQSGKHVADYIDTLLYTVFRDALQILMKDAKTLAKKYNGMSYRSPGDYPALLEKIVENEATIFALTSGRERGRKRLRQIDETRPIRLAQRCKTLEPLALALKHSLDDLKTKGRQDEAALLTEARKNFQGEAAIDHVLSLGAFRALLPNPDSILDTRLSLWDEWDPHQLVIGIITCEERRRRGRPILASTIKKLIDRGMEQI